MTLSEHCSQLGEIHMGIIDFVVLAIFLVALIVGTVKGFSRQFSVGVCVLLGCIGATAATWLLSDIVMNIPFVNSLHTTFAGWFKAEQLNTVVDTSLSVKEGTAAVSALLGETTFKFMSLFSETIYTAMVSSQVNTIAAMFGLIIVEIIADIVMWIVFFIVVYYIFRALRMLLMRITEIGLFRLIDRLIGAVVAVAITYCIVVVILMTGAEVVLAKWLTQWEQPFYNIVEQSPVLTFLHSTNVLGGMLAKAMGMTLPSLPFGG